MLIGGVLWGFYRYSTHNPGGNIFAQYYLATRTFLVDGASPYSDQTQGVIEEFFQIFLKQQSPDPHAVSLSPIYTLILYFPFAPIKYFNLSRAIWMTVQLGLFIISVFWALNTLKWHPNLKLLVLVIIFSLAGHSTVRSFVHGDFQAIILLLSVLFVSNLQRENRELSGVLLASLTVDFKTSWLIILFSVLWLISRKQWRTIIWAIGTLVGLSLVGVIFIGNWYLQFFWSLLEHSFSNPFDLLAIQLENWVPGIARQMAWILIVVGAVLILIEWVRSLGKEFPHFFWVFCYTLLFAGILNSILSNESLLYFLLSVLLIFSVWDRRWSKSGSLVIGIVYLSLTTGMWLILLMTNSPPGTTSFIVALLELLIVGLGMYWIRYWFTQYQPPALVDDYFGYRW